jgi:hypothetical protein
MIIRVIFKSNSLRSCREYSADLATIMSLVQLPIYCSKQEKYVNLIFNFKVVGNYSKDTIIDFISLLNLEHIFQFFNEDSRTIDVFQSFENINQKFTNYLKNNKYVVSFHPPHM